MFETPSFTSKSFGWDSKVLESQEEILAVLETFFPSGVRDSVFYRVLGGCLTIMMCNVFGVTFWGVGGGFWGDAFKLMLES